MQDHFPYQVDQGDGDSGGCGVGRDVTKLMQGRIHDGCADPYDGGGCRWVRNRWRMVGVTVAVLTTRGGAEVVVAAALINVYQAGENGGRRRTYRLKEGRRRDR